MNRNLNLDLDLSKVKESLTKALASLRGNRLWPLAIVLLVAIVAVPVLLSKSSSATPTAAAPGAAAAPGGTAVPALNVQTKAGNSRLPGRGRDPFGGQAASQTTSSSVTTSAVAVKTAGTSASGSAKAASAGGSSGGGTSSAAPPTSTPTAPPSIVPKTTPKPAPSGLTSTQSYGVTLAMTEPSGGLNTIDSLERLSVLPNQSQPLLVELGVLKGGHRVLFLVQPGTVLNGPGTCTPGPIDCEILSLGQDQTEGLSTVSSSGTTQVALFAVTGITAVNHPSVSAANKVRRQESAAGRSLANASTSQAFSLFQYDPTLGVVVDESNLTARDP